MKKKALIIGLVVYFILLASSATVSAIDEFEEYTDDENDVLDMLSESNISRPNIDIINVEYSRIGKNVKITLTVKGNIQDAGDLDNFEDFPMIYYNVLLATDTYDYDIIYINKVVNLSNNGEDVSYEVDGSDLELSFTLNSDEEIYDSIIILTTEFKSMTELYADEFTSGGFDTLDVEAGGPYEGKTGESIEFSGSVFGGTGPYEWEWDFDGDFITDSTERNPTWTYDTKGEYDITLTVTDSFDDQDFDFTSVEITASGNGNNGTGDNSLMLFVGLIVIVVIVGIGVLVYVIRR